MAPDVARADARAGEARVGAGLTLLGVFRDGVGDPEQTTSVAVGVASSGPGLEVGAMVSDHVLLGATLAFLAQDFFSSGSGASDGDLRFVLELVPHVQVLFGEGSTRPFVGAEWGFLWSEASSQAYMIAGALGGVHGFVSDVFAISPWVSLGYFGDVSGEDAFRLELAVSFSGFF